jgi:hypothetical protein
MLTAGIWLYGLGVFISAAFNIDVGTTIIVTEISVLLISLIEGSWAVVALMGLIPNPPSGRLAFVFCGGVFMLVGGLLVKQARQPAPPPKIKP